MQHYVIFLKKNIHYIIKSILDIVFCFRNCTISLLFIFLGRTVTRDFNCSKDSVQLCGHVETQLQKRSGQLPEKPVPSGLCFGLARPAASIKRRVARQPVQHSADKCPGHVRRNFRNSIFENQRFNSNHECYCPYLAHGHIPKPCCRFGYRGQISVPQLYRQSAAISKQPYSILFLHPTIFVC